MNTVKVFCSYALAITTLLVSAAHANTLSPAKWLASAVGETVEIDMQVDKHKLSFKGCKQTRYSLTMSRQLAPDWQVEAIAHYGRGALSFGTLTQTVKTQALELVAWHEFNDDMRVGVMHKAQPGHEIVLLMGDDLDLPTSKTLGLYVDMEIGISTEQSVRITLLRETWNADSASVPLAWRRSQDSQVQLSYSMAF
ncbi:hypothetical protein [Alteromonas halophila]|uniref:Uncharacterized protein n=1 Tax=Alteromonas halophila TaxID=516698 RepID=A0A918JG84_9ALTE|nr:hypothetical protein [Alteromonas halophila]GGW78465.1 hypothetical protein GCM10007391_08830 [Alteromonas halophila]